jgi:hypothetical protein
MVAFSIPWVYSKQALTPKGVFFIPDKVRGGKDCAGRPEKIKNMKKYLLT